MTAAQPQLLHWVFKTSHLKHDVLEFFKRQLGMHVLRHEEFKQGCDAQCNGPYSRPWSKTMIGYGPESSHFVVELAFNYGIPSYPSGHDFRCLLLAGPRPPTEAEAEAEGKTSTELRTKDGYECHWVTEEMQLERYAQLLKRETPHLFGVSLFVNQLNRARDFYCHVLGMQASPVYTVHGQQALHVYYPSNAPSQGRLLVELVESELPVTHAQAGGRLAIAVPSDLLDSLEQNVRQCPNAAIHTERVRLDTPGKATVEVVIVLDADQYEICLVGAEGFWELSAPVQGGDEIDFTQRIENGSKEERAV